MFMSVHEWLYIASAFFAAQTVSALLVAAIVMFLGSREWCMKWIVKWSYIMSSMIEKMYDEDDE